eukprot:gene9216-16360_t
MATKGIRFLRRQYGAVAGDHEFSSFTAMHGTTIGIEEGLTSYLVRCQEMYSQIHPYLCTRGAYKPKGTSDTDNPTSTSSTNGSKSPRRRSGSRSPTKDRYGRKTGPDWRRYKGKPISGSSDVLTQHWVVDSGATDHATSEINNLSHVHELDEPVTLLGPRHRNTPGVEDHELASLATDQQWASDSYVHSLPIVGSPEGPSLHPGQLTL